MAVVEVKKWCEVQMVGHSKDCVCKMYHSNLGLVKM